MKNWDWKQHILDWYKWYFTLAPIIPHQTTNGSNTPIFALHVENKLTQLTQSQTKEVGFNIRSSDFRACSFLSPIECSVCFLFVLFLLCLAYDKVVKLYDSFLKETKSEIIKSHTFAKKGKIKEGNMFAFTSKFESFKWKTNKQNLKVLVDE